MLISQTLYATLSDDLSLWYVLNQSSATYRALCEYFGSSTIALEQTLHEWQTLGVHASHKPRFEAWQAVKPAGVALMRRRDALLAQLVKGQMQCLQPQMTGYPLWLAEIDDAPPFLFVRGPRAVLDYPQVGIVGTRKPSPSARQIATDFAHQLARSGFWITSGLAQGIDAEAHRGALAAGQGQTIAVLGTGLDVCYPRSHRPLYDQILHDGGVLVSEYVPDTTPEPYLFPRRNRVISGLSRGILVIEAALKSGSLITARLAAEQNRDVFAVPGHIHNDQAHGCLQLIRDGAVLVFEPEQIIEALGVPSVSRPEPPLSEAQANDPAIIPAIPDSLLPLWHQLDWQLARSIDQLVDLLNLEVSQLAADLMALELLGAVHHHAGGYCRCLPLA